MNDITKKWWPVLSKCPDVKSEHHDAFAAELEAAKQSAGNIADFVKVKVAEIRSKYAEKSDEMSSVR